jgi:hypothetical protein
MSPKLKTLMKVIVKEPKHVNHAIKNVLHIRKKTLYLQFCMGTPEGHQKIYLIPQK